jgi:hypothetical protein
MYLQTWGGGSDRLTVFLQTWRGGGDRLAGVLLLWQGDRLAGCLLAQVGGSAGLAVCLQTLRGGRYWLGMVRVLMASQSLVCFTGLELTCHKITQMTVE